MGKAKKPAQASSSRFMRSVNLEHDIWSPDALNGYVITAGVRRALMRIAPATSDSHAGRVWTVTGPYGTGKSAFVLFLVWLFSYVELGIGTSARRLLEACDEELARKILRTPGAKKDLFPVVVTGSREPLALALLRGLRGSLNVFRPRKTAGFRRKVETLFVAATEGDPPTTAELTALFGECLETICDGKDAPNGLLLVVDELGKLLEHATTHGESSDIFVLQSLAEFAARSSQPFLIAGVLHQDFSLYGQHLSPRERAEWAKVRGRFEDIAFEEPADEIIRLIAQARAHARRAKAEAGLEAAPPKIRAAFGTLCDGVWKLDLAPAGVTKKEFIALLRDCWPLHPLVTVLLGPLFRRLAQNERSVFSFLYSAEPGSLAEHIASNGNAPSVTFTIEQLYDYLVSSLGDGLYIHARGKRWAEIETVLDRLPGASPLEIATVKTVGLLGAVGQWQQLRATPEIVKLALTPQYAARDVEQAEKSLLSQSALASRRYNNSLALWEGSDVDLDQQFRTARDRLSPETTTAELAARFMEYRPLVARRHSFETGSLRFFDVRFVNPDNLSAEVEQTSSRGADGTVFIVLSENQPSRDAALTAITSPDYCHHNDLLWVIPNNVQPLADAIRETACLDWIKNNTPELEGDRTARLELRARHADLQRKVSAALESILAPSAATTDDCQWYHCGQLQEIQSRRELNGFLSALADSLYPQTPRIRNELVNRQELSSAAAAARRSLLEAMLEHANKADLGFQGSPPEKSMYLSLLCDPGIHRKLAGCWQFAPPRSSADPGIQATWDAIHDFFASTENGARPIVELYGQLAAPPYGMKSGPMPILLCAALLANDATVALYEEGSFVPQTNIAMFERLLRSPDSFTLQRWRITGVRAQVFQRLAELLGREPHGSTKRDILDVVRPLCRFASELNDYVRYTQTLSPTAIAIRETLLQARQPDRLLFTDLPEACGMRPFKARGKINAADLDSFVNALRDGLGELQRCYDELLGELGASIGSAFGLNGSMRDTRAELARRAADLASWVADASLKSFALRAADTQLDDTAWIESISALITHRPPAVWRDDSRAKFELELSKIARLFSNVEALGFPSKISEDTQAAKPIESLRIGITTADARERAHVVRVTAETKKRVDQIEKDIQKIVAHVGKNGNTDLAIAALARVTSKLLK